jgi:hypothetical protein
MTSTWPSLSSMKWTQTTSSTSSWKTLMMPRNNYSRRPWMITSKHASRLSALTGKERPYRRPLSKVKRDNSHIILS